MISGFTEEGNSPRPTLFCTRYLLNRKQSPPSKPRQRAQSFHYYSRSVASEFQTLGEIRLLHASSMFILPTVSCPNLWRVYVYLLQAETPSPLYQVYELMFRWQHKTRRCGRHRNELEMSDLPCTAAIVVFFRVKHHFIVH